jgi:hypothetical protein
MPIAFGCLVQFEEQRLHVFPDVPRLGQREVASSMARGTLR